MSSNQEDAIRVILTKLHGWLDCGVFTDGTLQRSVSEMLKLRTEVEAALAVPASSPDRASRPQDTYHWGETMAQYAALGIGVEAWVELTEIERKGLQRRNNDRSGESISWGTFRLVMKVLRAIRIEDFKEVETLRLRAERAEGAVPASSEVKNAVASCTKCGWSRTVPCERDDCPWKGIVPASTFEKLRTAFDAYLIAMVNRHNGIPHLPPEEMELQSTIAELLAEDK